MNIITIANILQLYKRRPNKPCVIEVIEKKWRLCNVLQEENIVTPWWRAESEISAAGFVRCSCTERAANDISVLSFLIIARKMCFNV